MKRGWQLYGAKIIGEQVVVIIFRTSRFGGRIYGSL